MQKLEEFFRKTTQRAHLIIDIRYFFNAKDSEGVPFDLLRQCIMEVAESLPEWGLRIPCKWIILENSLAGLKSEGRKIMSVKDIMDVFQKEDDFERQEIEDFLHFQNSMRKVLYFKEANLHEHVVLDPKLVIDALSLLITDEHFTKSWSTSEFREWCDLRQKGQIRRQFIDQLWTKSQFSSFRGHLIDVLCRLDLMTRSKEEDVFYVPSMVQQTCPLTEINKIRQGVEIGLVSFKFSFQNKFLPPAVFSRLVGTLLSLFDKGSHSVTKLYSDCVIFEVLKSKWMVMCKMENEIEFYTYHEDKRGKVESPKSYEYCLKLAMRGLTHITKTYSAFQRSSTQKHEMPFVVLCQCCRKKDSCYLTKEDFRGLKEYRCPKHKETLTGFETLGGIFGDKVYVKLCRFKKWTKFLLRFRSSLKYSPTPFSVRFSSPYQKPPRWPRG